VTVLGPIGRWFQARVNNGVDDAIRMAIIDGHGEVKRAWLIPHRLHDGRSALRQIFRFLDIAFAEPPLNPRMQRMPLLRLLAARPWRSIPVAAAPAWRHEPAGRDDDAVAEPVFRVLDRNSRDLLQCWADGHGVSLTAVMLWAQHRAVMKSLCRKDSGGIWFVPVDMRPAVAGEGNGSGGVYIHLRPGCSPADVHAALGAALKAGQHWWLWLQAVWVARLGQRLLDWLYPRLARPGQYVGSFSALGQWQVSPGDALAAGDSFYICGPGSPAYPVSNGFTQVNDHISLVLRVDRGVDPDGVLAPATLAAWAGILEQLCSDARRQQEVA